MGLYYIVSILLDILLKSSFAHSKEEAIFITRKILTREATKLNSTQPQFSTPHTTRGLKLSSSCFLQSEGQRNSGNQIRGNMRLSHLKNKNLKMKCFVASRRAKWVYSTLTLHEHKWVDLDPCVPNTHSTWFFSPILMHFMMLQKQGSLNECGKH